MEEELQSNLRRAETLWKARFADSLDDIEAVPLNCKNWEENLMALEALKAIARIRQLHYHQMPRSTSA